MKNKIISIFYITIINISNSAQEEFQNIDVSADDFDLNPIHEHGGQYISKLENEKKLSAFIYSFLDDFEYLYRENLLEYYTKCIYTTQQKFNVYEYLAFTFSSLKNIGKNTLSSVVSSENFFKEIEREINSLTYINSIDKEKFFEKLRKIKSLPLSEIKEILNETMSQKSYIKLITSGTVGAAIGTGVGAVISSLTTYLTTSGTTVAGLSKLIAGTSAGTIATSTGTIAAISFPVVGFFIGAGLFASYWNDKIDKDNNINLKESKLYTLLLNLLYLKIKEMSWFDNNLILTAISLEKNAIGINFVFDKIVERNYKNNRHDLVDKQEIIRRMGKRTCNLRNCENEEKCIKDILDLYRYKIQIKKGIKKEDKVKKIFKGCETVEEEKYDIYDDL